MSDNKVVDSMIEFIEDREKQLQAEKMLGENSAKNDIVKAILDQLDKEVSNENK
jgi:hypothetical protein